MAMAAVSTSATLYRLEGKVVGGAVAAVQGGYRIYRLQLFKVGKGSTSSASGALDVLPFIPPTFSVYIHCTFSVYIHCTFTVHSVYTFTVHSVYTVSIVFCCHQDSEGDQSGRMMKRTHSADDVMHDEYQVSERS